MLAMNLAGVRGEVTLLLLNGTLLGLLVEPGALLGLLCPVFVAGVATDGYTSSSTIVQVESMVRGKYSASPSNSTVPSSLKFTHTCPQLHFGCSGVRVLMHSATPGPLWWTVTTGIGVSVLIECPALLGAIQ
jgi:hypothetical protein